MWLAGVDVGSISTEAVVIDGSGELKGLSIEATGADTSAAAERALHEALSEAGINREDLAGVISTGYGRERVAFATARVTEISCHGRGASSLVPEARTVVDIGGQDSKVIRIDGSGKVQGFQMNDKCAAGTGRFLEVMARALEVDLVEMGPLSLQSKEDVSVSSVCTVFAESEVVGLIHQGHDRKDIIGAIHRSVADRTRALVGRVGIQPRIILTGGVAKNLGVVKALQERLGHEVIVPEEPQIVGALGAALIARDKTKSTEQDKVDKK